MRAYRSAGLLAWAALFATAGLVLAGCLDADTLGGLGDELTRLWCRDGAYIHHNGRDMALLPPFAAKEKAVAFLMDKIRVSEPHPLFLGLGDSFSDLPFMKLCDYLITPTGSQIAGSMSP